MTRLASERVRVSTSWNSPSLSTLLASSSPGGGGLGREVGAWWDMVVALRRMDDGIVAMDVIVVNAIPSLEVEGLIAL